MRYLLLFLLSLSACSDPTSRAETYPNSYGVYELSIASHDQVSEKFVSENAQVGGFSLKFMSPHSNFVFEIRGSYHEDGIVSGHQYLIQISIRKYTNATFEEITILESSGVLAPIPVEYNHITRESDYTSMWDEGAIFTKIDTGIYDPSGPTSFIQDYYLVSMNLKTMHSTKFDIDYNCQDASTVISTLSSISSAN